MVFFMLSPSLYFPAKSVDRKQWAAMLLSLIYEDICHNKVKLLGEVDQKDNEQHSSNES